ncbi:MAG: hypothetical protein KBC18_04310 [Candidatus Saccharicenans sp.]|nr:hypothetical protein [Candidatus Saccharicenans sp.]
MNRMNLDTLQEERSRKNNLGPGEKLSAVIFWGSLWGLAEATAGYLLHLLKVPGLAGAVMATIAFYFLNRLYQQTGSAEAVVFSSFLAAGLKGLDLIFSPLSFMDIINPAQAIIIEGLLAALALQVLSRESIHSSPRIVPSCLLFSFGSNLTYSLVTLAESAVFPLSNIFEAPPWSLITFLVLSPLLTSALLVWLLGKSYSEKKETKGAKTAASTAERPVVRHFFPDLIRQFNILLEQAPFRPGVSITAMVLAVINGLIHY